jgi:hypothetical protein
MIVLAPLFLMRSLQKWEEETSLRDPLRAGSVSGGNLVVTVAYASGTVRSEPEALATEILL